MKENAKLTLIAVLIFLSVTTLIVILTLSLPFARDAGPTYTDTSIAAATPCPQCAASTATLSVTLATAEPEISPVATAPEPVATAEFRQQFVQVFLTDTLEISGVDLLNTIYDHHRTLPQPQYDQWFASQVQGSIISGGAWVRSRDLTTATLGWNQTDTEARLLFIGGTQEPPMGAVEFSGTVVDSLCVASTCLIVVQPTWLK